ncbi:hypothetical protein BDV32DRAFT_119161 [Aspergillus pseudonomiae]|nr:hypothetical protein BDV32DRAFT_119161 [Aspergillus pseudonomiae]
MIAELSRLLVLSVKPLWIPTVALCTSHISAHLPVLCRSFPVIVHCVLPFAQRASCCSRGSASEITVGQIIHHVQAYPRRTALPALDLSVELQGYSWSPNKTPYVMVNHMAKTPVVIGHTTLIMTF